MQQDYTNHITTGLCENKGPQRNMPLVLRSHSSNYRYAKRWCYCILVLLWSSSWLVVDYKNITLICVMCVDATQLSMAATGQRMDHPWEQAAAKKPHHDDWKCSRPNNVMLCKLLIIKGISQQLNCYTGTHEAKDRGSLCQESQRFNCQVFKCCLFVCYKRRWLNTELYIELSIKQVCR